MPETQSKKQASSVHCGKFEQTRLSYTELEIDNERNKAQMIAYPRYNHPNGGENAFIYQTDWITLSQYGLPKKGEKPGDFYMEDKDRTFLKVPLDPSQESCVELQKMLSGIDKYNTKNTDKIFKNFAASKNTTGAKAAKLFTYQPAVRTPQVDDEFAEVSDASGKTKTERFKYCKMPFTTSYPEKDITSAVYLRDKEGPDATVTKCKASSASDLENSGLVWGSKVRMIVMVNKLWAAKAKNPTTGTRGYGVTMKIVQLEVIPREKSGSIREQFSRYAFIDGEESDEVEQADADADASGGEDVEEDEEDVEEDEEVEEEDEVEEDEEVEDDEEVEVEEEEEEEEVVVAKSKSKKASASKKSGGKTRSTTNRR